MSDNAETHTPPPVLRDMRELSSAHIEPPPALVARVMTRLAEPRLPSLWQWLRQPFSIEIRLSPLALVGVALGLAVAFVLIGVTLK